MRGSDQDWAANRRLPVIEALKRLRGAWSGSGALGSLTVRAASRVRRGPIVTTSLASPRSACGADLVDRAWSGVGVTSRRCQSMSVAPSGLVDSVRSISRVAETPSIRLWCTLL